MSVCEICGATDNLERHHTSYEPKVIIILCRNCHRKEHKKPNAPKRPFTNIVIFLEDNDFETMKALKGEQTWLEFLVKPHLEKENSQS